MLPPTGHARPTISDVGELDTSGLPHGELGTGAVMSDGSRPTRSRSVTLPGILLGVGLGGFFDGIVLHQVLQWHHMLASTSEYPTSTVTGLEVNTLWDGLLHLVTYVFVAVGIFMLWDRARGGGYVWTWRSILGWVLLGWGIFNLAEGVVDHHVIRIHHVRPGTNELAWDLGFLGVGAILVFVGRRLARSDRPSEGRSHSSH